MIPATNFFTSFSFHYGERTFSIKSQTAITIITTKSLKNEQFVRKSPKCRGSPTSLRKYHYSTQTPQMLNERTVCLPKRKYDILA